MSSFKEVDALEISSADGKDHTDVDYRFRAEAPEGNPVFTYVFKDGTRLRWMDEVDK